MTEIVYELDINGYYDIDVELRGHAHEFARAHGFNPRRVKLDQTIRIERGEHDKLQLAVWVYDLGDGGAKFVGDDGNAVGREHVVPLRTVPPFWPEWTTVHHRFTAPGARVFEPTAGSDVTA